jgi:transcriptional regulator with XRE-family HTH domain
MESMHETVLKGLEATKGNWPEVARRAGVSYRTLKKIATGEISSPRVNNLEKLASYFREQAAA